MANKKFKKTIRGAEEFYESIQLYEDRLQLQKEFESKFLKEEIRYGREIKFYKWLRDNKL